MIRPGAERSREPGARHFGKRASGITFSTGVDGAGKSPKAR